MVTRGMVMSTMQWYCAFTVCARCIFACTVVISLKNYSQECGTDEGVSILSSNAAASSILSVEGLRLVEPFLFSATLSSASTFIC